MFDNDYDTYKNPIEGKTYISPPIINSYGIEGTIRIITRGIDSKETYKVAKVKDEIVLRETAGGKNIITAKVLENDRKLLVLNIQQYTAQTGNPHKLGFAFIGDEITKLFNFIRDVQTMQFGSERYQRLSDDDIAHIEITDKQAQRIVEENQELFSNILRSQITNEDIVTIGYRKKQVDIFYKLLTDKNYFSNVKKKYNYSSEKVWQTYFEKNQWIFGYGLGYVFLSSLDNKKLEQVVKGFTATDYGKRIDGLMKTKGVISNLCFVEIKTDSTKLLETSSYRSGCYAASRELVGAIAQVQGTVASAVKSLSEKLIITDSNGDPTGEEIYNYQPKSFLIIGNLNEFKTKNGINKDKLQSFELFRGNIQNVEILTFDELFERAKFIVEYTPKLIEKGI